MRGDAGPGLQLQAPPSLPQEWLRTRVAGTQPVSGQVSSRWKLSGSHCVLPGHWTSHLAPHAPLHPRAQPASSEMKPPTPSQGLGASPEEGSSHWSQRPWLCPCLNPLGVCLGFSNTLVSSPQPAPGLMSCRDLTRQCGGRAPLFRWGCLQPTLPCHGTTRVLARPPPASHCAPRPPPRRFPSTPWPGTVPLRPFSSWGLEAAVCCYMCAHVCTHRPWRAHTCPLHVRAWQVSRCESGVWPSWWAQGQARWEWAGGAPVHLRGAAEGAPQVCSSEEEAGGGVCDPGLRRDGRQTW